jgi:hypothetical protein
VTGVVEIRRTAHDIRHRDALIRHVRWFSIFWIVAVLAIIGASGVESLHFDLPSAVLVALVTTTTANVLGLAFIILRGMFGQKAPDHIPGSEEPRD